MKIFFEKLAYVIAQDKNAGIILSMILPKYEGEGRPVYINISHLSKATAIAQPNLSRSLGWLVENGYLEADPETSGFFFLSSFLVYHDVRETTNTQRLREFSPLPGPKVSRRKMTEVVAMNKLTDEEIGDAPFIHKTAPVVMVTGL